MAKKSAADIDALRWRDMFTSFGGGMFAKHGIATANIDRIGRSTNTKLVLEEAALAADYGMILFYNRYEREK